MEERTDGPSIFLVSPLPLPPPPLYATIAIPNQGRRGRNRGRRSARNSPNLAIQSPRRRFSYGFVAKKRMEKSIMGLQAGRWSKISAGGFFLLPKVAINMKRRKEGKRESPLDAKPTLPSNEAWSVSPVHTLGSPKAIIGAEYVPRERGRERSCNLDSMKARKYIFLRERGGGTAVGIAAAAAAARDPFYV